MYKKLYKKINEQLKRVYKSKSRNAVILLIFLSTIFLLTILIGSFIGTVYLNVFTFNEPLSSILQRKNIKFTLFGHCIDDRCSKNLTVNTEQAIKRQINPEVVSIDKANDFIDSTKKKIGETAKKEEEIVEEGLSKMKILFSAIDNLLPKEPTKDNYGFAGPIIATVVFNFFSLLLFFFNDQSKFIFMSILILLCLSFSLNIGIFFITSSIFYFLFNDIAKVPVIGDNRTGFAIYLLGLSSACLLIAIMIMINFKINK